MDYLDKIFPQVETMPFLNFTPDNYEPDPNISHLKYDPNIHLDLRIPQFIINLNFETLLLYDLNFQDQKDYDKIKNFLKSGLAFTAPFKIFSDEGLRVIRQIINYSIENKPHLSKHSERQAWCIRGLAYISEFIRDMNRCTKLAKFLSLFAGKKVTAHGMPMNYSHINIGMPGTGKKVDQWHLDSVGFELVVMISEPVHMYGGELQVLKYKKDDKIALEILNSQSESFNPKEIITVEFNKAGYGIFMQGSMFYHQVSAVKEAPQGSRISLVNSYMLEDCFEPDWTKFSYNRENDPEHISYLEYARLIAWRSSQMLNHLIHRTDFDHLDQSDSKDGSKKALGILRKTLDELNTGYELLSGKADETFGYLDSETKKIKGYKN